MKRICAIALSLLAIELLATDAAAQSSKSNTAALYDLSGEWQAAYHDPGSIDIEKVMIVNLGSSLVATKETGDKYVPAGKVTFRCVAPARLATKGFGKANPRFPNTNDDARAHNRRVEIVIED